MDNANQDTSTPVATPTATKWQALRERWALFQWLPIAVFVAAVAINNFRVLGKIKGKGSP